MLLFLATTIRDLIRRPKARKLRRRIAACRERIAALERERQQVEELARLWSSVELDPEE
jgi:hypothetical protein